MKRLELKIFCVCIKCLCYKNYGSYKKVQRKIKTTYTPTTQGRPLLTVFDGHTSLLWIKFV